MEAAQACDYVIELATTRIAAIDFTAKQRAAYRAKQRPKSPVTAARQLVDSQCANAGTDQQSCRAIFLAAVVTAVTATPDARIAIDKLAIIAAIIVVIAMAIGMAARMMRVALALMLGRNLTQHFDMGVLR